MEANPLPSFRIFLHTHKEIYPHVPKKYYREPDPGKDFSRGGSFGDCGPYNLDHYIKQAQKKDFNRLFKFGRGRNKGINVIDIKSAIKRKTLTEIKAENAGYLIIQNLILCHKWARLRTLFTNWLPPSIERIAAQRTWQWAHGITPLIKRAFVLRIYDALVSIFLQIHRLAPLVWDCKLNCPNMEKPMLWQSLCEKDANFFTYQCHLRRYTVEFGYLDGTLLSKIFYFWIFHI